MENLQDLINAYEVDLQDLKNASDDLERAMHNISGIEGLEDEYRQLEVLIDIVEDKIGDTELKIRDLEEEKEAEENAELWAKEKRDQEREYWASQF